MRTENVNPEHLELETALMTIAPCAARLDPVAAAFEAGRRSQRRQANLWRSAAAALLLAGLALWMFPNRVVPPAQQDRTGSTIASRQSTAPAEPLADQSLLMLQAVVREGGLDRLPTADPPPVRAFRPGDLF
jgi:hypothetical protein